MVILFVLAGCTGTDGQMGEMGDKGDKGDMGDMGTMGTPGAGVTVQPEPAGANCATGGIAMTSATGTAYICNGTSGTNGTNGTNGVDATAPAGAIVGFGGSTAPTGWLICDGSAVSRTTYAALFAAIGITYGPGNGVDTFNLPDTRGVFLRGEGSQTIGGVTYTSASRGVLQGDLFRSHNHGGGNHNHTAGAIDISGGAYNPNGAYLGRVVGAPNLSNTVSPSGTIIGTEGGAETRPANLTINYIIRS